MPVAPGDRAEFRALVDELADLEARHAAGGGAAGDAARRPHVEQRLIQLVTTEIPQDERRRHVRLPCDLPVVIHAGGESANGVVVDVGTGGIFVDSPLALGAGDAVEVEIEGMRVTGKVAWAATTRRTGRPGLGIAFSPGAGDEAGERGLRQFVIALLRKHLSPA